MSDRLPRIIWLPRFLCLALLLLPLSVSPIVAADESADSLKTTLKAAYEHRQHGRYAEAREVYEQAEQELADLTDKPVAEQWELIQGMILIDLASGQRNQAHERLQKALETLPEHAPLQALAAKLYYEAGDYPSAEKHVQTALTLNPDQPLAHLIQAHLLTDAGKIDEANEAFRWFVRYYNRAQPEDAETLLVIAQGATQYARWNSVSQIFNFVINTLCPDVLKADPLAWRASYLSGSILQEKYNRPQAADEFAAALKTNSQATEVYVALARSAIEVRDFDKGTDLVNRALKINPESIEAILAQCDLHLIDGQLTKALASAQAAARLNQYDQSVLARLAACYLLQEGVPEKETLIAMFDSSTPEKDTEKTGAGSHFAKLVSMLLKRNPKPGYFLFELAQIMETRRQFEFAEFAYLKTIALMPQLSGPRTSLGMLYMQMGKTDLAQQTLNDAFQADPYHVRVSNMRKVLGVLESYGAIVTEHFIIRYDSKADFILGKYMAEYLEQIYPELAEQFGYEPPGKTQFEIYHNAKGLAAHQWFSARMIGLPWIQTIGASTGAVVALTSPTAVQEPYNWASVLKHELVHVFTLQQTKYKIPHWFTEALAVRSEGSARPQRFNQLLVERIPQGEIYPLDELDSVFVRPKSSDNWSFAYCQSLLCAEFMVAEFGDDALKKLLLAYQRQRTTPQAIQESFGIDQEEFEKRYHKYLKELTTTLKGYPTESSLSFRELASQYEATPDDPGIAGRYAAALLRFRKKQEARSIARKVLASQPGQPEAALTIASLEVLSGDLKAATEVLKPALKEGTPDVSVMSLAGKLFLKQDQIAEALKVYRSGHESYPYQTEWLQGLSLIYQRQDDSKNLQAKLLKLVHLDPADAASLKLLMQLYLEQNDLEQALHWGQEALYVDVLDPEIHQTLSEIALELNRGDLAIRELGMVLYLDDKNEDVRYQLAKVLFEADKKEDAKAQLELLLKQNPQHAAALALKEKL